MSLRLRERERGVLHSHLCRAYPEEGCGVLLGRERDGVREVARAIALPNQREDSRANRYLIAPEQFLAAEREARATALEVVGFFHSHPDHPAAPSAFDLEQAWPYYSYVIASIAKGSLVDLRSYRLSDDRSQFEPETLELLDGASGADPDAEGEQVRWRA